MLLSLETECLYIATKFNDVARARLVIRWQQLEKERLMHQGIRHLLVTAQRMTCCLMLCKVCELLIQRQMLKNWKRQGLVIQAEAGRYRKK